MFIAKYAPRIDTGMVDTSMVMNTAVYWKEQENEIEG